VNGVDTLETPSRGATGGRGNSPGGLFVPYLVLAHKTE